MEGAIASQKRNDDRLGRLSLDNVSPIVIEPIAARKPTHR
jgi:hypothetical protein